MVQVTVYHNPLHFHSVLQTQNTSHSEWVELSTAYQDASPFADVGPTAKKVSTGHSNQPLSVEFTSPPSNMPQMGHSRIPAISIGRHPMSPSNAKSPSTVFALCKDRSLDQKSLSTWHPRNLRFEGSEILNTHLAG
jgi:hypothetical protein